MSRTHIIVCQSCLPLSWAISTHKHTLIEIDCTHTERKAWWEKHSTVMQKHCVCIPTGETVCSRWWVTRLTDTSLRPGSQSREILLWHRWLSRHSAFGVCVVTLWWVHWCKKMQSDVYVCCNRSRCVTCAFQRRVTIKIKINQRKGFDFEPELLNDTNQATAPWAH